MHQFEPQKQNPLQSNSKEEIRFATESELQSFHKPRVTFWQAARLVGVSRNTIVRWARTGLSGRVLDSFKVGGRRYVLLSTLTEFVNLNGASRSSETSKADREFQKENAKARLDSRIPKKPS